MKYTIKLKQYGMSILELMVAVTIFMIITVAIFTLYINSNTSYNQDEIAARMQENGRFALNMIAKDLIMVNFWGEMLTGSTIDTTAFASAGDECGTDLRDTSEALLYYNYSAGTPMFDPTSCTSVIGTVKSNTNALAIKRVDNSPDTTPYDNIIYLRTNGFSGALIKNANSVAAPADFNDWAYEPKLYYIRDNANGVPFLCVAELVNTGYIDSATTTGMTTGVSDIDFATIASADDCIAEGIQQLHVEFGIDTDADGVANQYKSDITASEAGDAVSARIYLLVRASREDATYTNDKTYNLGHLATIAAANDNFYRRVYSTTVQLRNPRAYIQLGF